MGKPGKERQKKYLEKLKLKNKESYLQKERERKRKQRVEMKSNEKKYQEHLEKDRVRKRKLKEGVSVKFNNRHVVLCNLCTDYDFNQLE